MAIVPYWTWELAGVSVVQVTVAEFWVIAETSKAEMTGGAEVGWETHSYAPRS